EMGVSYALPAALPFEARRESATREPFVDDPAVSDSDLIRRVARRDANAFEALYRRYSRPVFGLALRRLGDRMNAEDAVQDTFAAIWRSARSYKPDRGPGEPWLFAVARNAIADGGRRRLEPPTEAPEEASQEAGPAERAEQEWVSWRIHRALEELPEHEREVGPLGYWSGPAPARTRSGARGGERGHCARGRLSRRRPRRGLFDRARGRDASDGERSGHGGRLDQGRRAGRGGQLAARPLRQALAGAAGEAVLRAVADTKR